MRSPALAVMSALASVAGARTSITVAPAAGVGAFEQPLGLGTPPPRSAPASVVPTVPGAPLVPAAPASAPPSAVAAAGPPAPVPASPLPPGPASPAAPVAPAAPAAVLVPAAPVPAAPALEEPAAPVALSPEPEHPAPSRNNDDTTSARTFGVMLGESAICGRSCRGEGRNRITARRFHVALRQMGPPLASPAEA